MKTLVAFLLMGSFAQAAGTYSECMEKSGGVTSSMVECADKELSLQDKKLNAAYSATVKTLNTFQKKKLLDAQRLWIQFRDASCAFYTDPKGGSIQLVQQPECLLALTKTRTEDIENLKNDN